MQRPGGLPPCPAVRAAGLLPLVLALGYVSPHGGQAGIGCLVNRGPADADCLLAGDRGLAAVSGQLAAQRLAEHLAAAGGLELADRTVEG